MRTSSFALLFSATVAAPVRTSLVETAPAGSHVAPSGSGSTSGTSGAADARRATAISEPAARG